MRKFLLLNSFYIAVYHKICFIFSEYLSNFIIRVTVRNAFISRFLEVIVKETKEIMRTYAMYWSLIADFVVSKCA